MMYRNIRTGSIYQYIGVGWMALSAPLTGAAPSPLVMARDPNGRNHIYVEDAYFPKGWTVRGEAKLVMDPSRLLVDDDEVVVYRGEDGCWFVSPAGEFFDGRHVAYR